METTTVQDRVSAVLEGLAFEVLDAADGIPTFLISPDAAPETFERLRDRGDFESVTFVTAVDRYPDEPRFEVSTQLYSIKHKDRVRVRILAGGDEPSVPTVSLIWPGAGFMERECFDMFGVRFDGHTDLRRLLMPEGYGHHPLRKDFPHQGIEPDRLYREWDEARRREWDKRS